VTAHFQRPSQSSQPAIENAQALSRLAEIADELGETSTSTDIRELVGRVNEGRFFVACVGQFKRGKSTLLDALVGESILPIGVLPVTTVPTVLRYGTERAARVLIKNRWQTIRPEDLGRYVSEEFNPENQKAVAGVEVFLPSPLLAAGMCLVDTPGVGSVFTGNTEATKAFIPQIDAAILVVGADPPISGDELALIAAVAANVDRIVIVLNKTDRVSLAERQQAAAFACKVLEAHLKKPIDRIYEFSALNHLNHETDGDDWDAFAEDLRRMASSAGQDTTRSAAARGLRRFSASLRGSVEERIRALREPIEDSERRIADLRQTFNQAEQSLRDLGALLSAEQMRLSNAFLARRKKFLQDVFPTAASELRQETKEVRTNFGPSLRRELMLAAQTIARRHVMPWLESEETHAEELYSSATQRFVRLANGFLERIAEEQSATFADLPKSQDLERGFRTQSRFYFHDMLTIAQPASPLLYCTDLVMGGFHVRRWFEKDADHLLENLLDTNASRVQGDAEQRVAESRLCLESDIRKLLGRVSATADQALTNARTLMAEGAGAVANELERLGKFRDELKEVAGSD
jgi:hypothetical protein